jgi:uncharacterized membrane protein (UPF0127 family)
MLIYRVMSRNKKMMLILFIVALILFIVGIGIWWRVFFGTPNPPLPQTSVSILSSSTAAVSDTASSSVVDGENPPLPEEQLSVDGAMFNVEIASTSLEQARGLSFRPSLGTNDGMLFIFGTGSVQTFWMQGMNFPLDMIWIRGTTVDGFTQNVPAPGPGTQVWELPIYPSPANTDKVLEVNAGTVAKYNIKVGDTVTIAPLQ